MRQLNGFEIEVYNQYGIKEGSRISICPECSHTRKKKTDKCAMVDWTTGLLTCQHCGKVLQLHKYKKSQSEMKPTKQEYKLPQISPFSGVYSDNIQRYIVDTRQLDLSALKRLKIRECKEWMPQVEKEVNCIAFDYYYNGILINTKFRDAAKNFKLVKGAEKIIYNLDAIKGKKHALIVEGEFDVVAWETAGIDFGVSVPNGFTIKGTINLDYLDNYIELFDDKEIIYIGVDDDEAGQKGETELIRRFGAERCKIISYGASKDANGYLKDHGKLALKSLISTAKDVKVEGIYSVEDVRDSMWNRYKNGQKRGTTTYFSKVDKAWTWREGEVTVWTGYQNEGKSLWVNQLALLKAMYDGYKFGIFSPENTPVEDFYTDLIEPIIGKSADPAFKNNYMSEQEYKYAESIINEHFFVIYPEVNFKLDTIFEKAAYLVKKHGIRALIIDPYNTIEHLLDRGEREDMYISRFMAQLKRFAIKHDISVHLVAHQLTARKDKDTGLYTKPDINAIKGGGTFADKADNANIVWRPNRAINFRDPNVIFASQKIKKQKLVGEPQEIEGIRFDIKTQRYYIDNFTPFDMLDKRRYQIHPELEPHKEIKYSFDENSGDIFTKTEYVKNELPREINGISHFETEFTEPPF